MSEELFRGTTKHGESVTVAMSVAEGRSRHCVPIGCMNVSFDLDDLSDLRPVRVVEDSQIVLDLDGITNDYLGVDAKEVVELLRLEAQKMGPAWRSVVLGRLADQIESQSKLPCIDEPGLFGVVKARTENGERELHWTHWTQQPSTEPHWISSEGKYAYWEKLIDPQLVRDGL